MVGVLVNMVAIVVGGALGLVVKKVLNKEIEDLIMKGMGLCVMYVGIDGVLDGENALITVISMAVGAVIGGLLDLDGKLNRFANKIEAKFVKGNESGFARSFTTGTLMYCIGAMAIVGSIEAGFGDNATLITKGIIDGVTGIIFASTLGWGVIAACIPVGIHQGAIVLLASVLTLSDHIIAEMCCAGSLLIIALSLNMLGLTKIKVMNLLPGMFIPILLCQFM